MNDTDSAREVVQSFRDQHPEIVVAWRMPAAPDFAAISRGFDAAARQFAAASISLTDATRELRAFGAAMRLVDTSDLARIASGNWVQRHYRRIRDRKGRR